jgi:hypothetical protein
VGEQVRSALRHDLPEYDNSRTEVYLSSSPQIRAPLRADRITAIGSGVLGKVKNRTEEYGGRKRSLYEAHCRVYYT